MTLNRLSLPYNDHDCLIDWNASSGAMDAGLAFDLVIKIHEMFKGLVYIKEIITDDNSTIRSHLKISQMEENCLMASLSLFF